MTRVVVDATTTPRASRARVAGGYDRVEASRKSAGVAREAIGRRAIARRDVRRAADGRRARTFTNYVYVHNAHTPCVRIFGYYQL